MTIPPGKTEAEVLKAIEKAVSILAPSFVFGHYGLDDIKQEGYVFAFQALDTEKFDPARPLENFLYTHIRNRLINLKRNKLRRNDPPCKHCHEGKVCPDLGTGEPGHCSKYSQWLTRNQAKANLANPLALEHVCDEKERRTRTTSSAEDDVEIEELLVLIDEKLPLELRQTYLQMRAGVAVTKTKRLQVEKVIIEICGGAIETCPSEED